MNLRQALSAAAAELATNVHLRDSASRDAEFLLLNQLGIGRAQLLANPGRELTDEEESSFRKSITRRGSNEPIQYITGQQEFYGLVFNVTPAVLIPRPETEHLVETVLQLLPADKPQTIVDVGTGSGAIAIALAVNLPRAKIVAVDISVDALAVASRNARTHDVANRIRFLQSDLLDALPAVEESFDAIVSNPPYIAETDRDSLHPQVGDHEPAVALFSGETGLEIYRRLIPEAYRALRPDGLLALEIGHNQHDAIASLLNTWQKLSFVNDLQDIPRVAIARKPANPPIQPRVR